MMATHAADICKRDIVQNTLLELQNATQNNACRAKCHSFLERLNYTAPEMINNLWQDVYRFLTTQLPLQESLLPIWNKASRKYNAV